MLHADEELPALPRGDPQLPERLHQPLPEGPVADLVEPLPELFGDEDAPASVEARDPAIQFLEGEHPALLYVAESAREAPEILPGREDVDALQEGVVELAGDRDEVGPGQGGHGVFLVWSLHKARPSVGPAEPGESATPGAPLFLVLAVQVTTGVYRAGLRVARIDGSPIPVICTTAYCLTDRLGSTRKVPSSYNPPGATFPAGVRALRGGLGPGADRNV
jgi:hypothetical protein